MMISIIAAMSENRVIGKDNDIPWRIPGEQKRFKDLTIGKTVIWGRKTFESIGKPLPGRRNMILTRNHEYFIDGCETVHSLEEAFRILENEEEVFIGGGEKVYSMTLPFVDKIFLTIIHIHSEGDTFFPHIGENFKLVKTEFQDGEIPYTYQEFERLSFN